MGKVEGSKRAQEGISGLKKGKNNMVTMTQLLNDLMTVINGFGCWTKKMPKYLLISVLIPLQSCSVHFQMDEEISSI